jgi:hypothetical protein
MTLNDLYERIQPILDTIQELMEVAEEVSSDFMARRKPMFRQVFPVRARHRFARHAGCHAAASSRFSARAPCRV